MNAQLLSITHWVRSVLIGGGAILLLLFPARAHALTITPIRYEISGNPGETLQHEMTLVNESDRDQLYYVSFANFEAQGDSGSPSFADPTEGLGTWITTAQSTVNLGAGEQKIIPFTITIPSSANPGGYFAAVFWGTTPTNRSGELSIGTKTGILILLSVNGEVTESAGLLDFQTQEDRWFYKSLPVGFEYRFSNQGGDRVKPEGFVNVYSILGWRVEKVNANQFDGNVLPGTTRKFTPEWAKRDSVNDTLREKGADEPYSFTQEVRTQWHNFAFGIFRAKVSVVFGVGDEMAKSGNAYFVVLPLELLLVMLAFGSVAFLILRTLLRRYNRSIMRKVETRIKAQQSI